MNSKFSASFSFSFIWKTGERLDVNTENRTALWWHVSEELFRVKFVTQQSLFRNTIYKRFIIPFECREQERRRSESSEKWGSLCDLVCTAQNGIPRSGKLECLLLMLVSLLVRINEVHYMNVLSYFRIRYFNVVNEAVACFLECLHPKTNEVSLYF